MVDTTVTEPFSDTSDTRFVANFAPIHRGIALVRGIGATAARYAPLPVRLMMGIGFLFHGLPKLSGVGHANFAAMLGAGGVPAPSATAWFVGLVETIGAVGLLAGALTGLWAVLLSINMIVAAVMVHAPWGFGFMNIIGQGPGGTPILGMPGVEVNLLYLSALVALFLSGAGPLSVDAWWDLRKREAAPVTEP